jgi:RND family efflux transporter MFP subunit
VKRGDLLATIAPAPAAPEAAARAALAVVEADARVQSARAALDRAERLIADRAISQREVDEARLELRVAEESVQAARRAREVFSGAASGRGGGTYRITAPIDGVVVEVQATAGKSVQSGELLLRVVNLNELWIRARVPEQEAARLRSDQDAAFKLPGLDSWLPLDVTGDDAAASVVNVGRTVDRRSRTVDVIYALRQPDDRLRVGAMVRVAVPAGEPWHGVIVPRDAVLEDDGRSVVFVQVEGEAFEERAVQVGPRSGSVVALQRGVQANERVVTRGANVIRLSSRASSTPAHGHVH